MENKILIPEIFTLLKEEPERAAKLADLYSKGLISSESVNRLLDSIMLNIERLDCRLKLFFTCAREENPELADYYRPAIIEILRAKEAVLGSLIQVSGQDMAATIKEAK